MRKTWVLAAFAMATVSGLTVVALGDEVVDADYKIKMDPPAGYKVESPSPTFTIFTDPKDEVQFVVIKAPDKAAADLALTGFQKQVRTDIPDLHATGKPTVGMKNGMETSHLDLEGTTTAKEATKIAVATFKTPSGKYLVVAGAVKTKTLGAHAAEIKKFMDSIRPS